MVRRFSVRADLAPVLADLVGPAARRAQVARGQVDRARPPREQVDLARVPRPVVRRGAHLVPVPVVQAVPVGRLAPVPVVPEVLRAAEPWAMAVSR